MMVIHIPPDMIPRMDWNAEDKQAAWAFYRERLEQYFMIAGTPNEAKVTHILFYGGKEASERWTALKDQVEGNKDDSDTVFKAFANSFEKSSSHWQVRDEYLSDIKQNKHQTTAELDIYIKDLIRRCQFPHEDQESRKIDLLYHATAHFEVRKFVHNAKPEELKYDHMIEVAKAHERTCQEYQIHKQAHAVAPPSNIYSNPLMQTNALSKSFQKGPPKKTCGKCRCSHSHGDCPAHGTTCSKCGRLNHWAQQCRSSGRRNSSPGHSPSPGRPQNRQRCFSGNKPNKGRGRGGGGSGKQKSTPKRPGGGRGRGGGKPFKTNTLTVTGLSGPQHPPKVDGLGGNETKESVSMNAGLPRPAHPPKVSGEPFINIFACDALTSNGNELYDPPSNQGKAYTDTDSDGKTEIITDITCKFKGKLVAMEVKVDPGSETNCIPLSHFRHLFPQLCRQDGTPKENALEPTLAQFEAYDGGIMTSHGWIILPTQDIRDSNKFNPVRYYVVTREEARILISYATATWLGHMKVLCPNKAPRIKRQVASVSKKARVQSDSSNSNSLSGPEHPPKVKYFYNNDITTQQHPPKVKYTGTVTVNEQQHEMPTSKPHSHGRKHRRGKPAHREEEGQVANRSVEFQSFQVDTKGATSMGGRQSVLPCQISTPSRSEIKSLSNNRYCSSTSRTTTPSQSEISGFLPKRPYYQPQEDQDTYYINSEGHLQCHQDSQNIIKAPTPQELPGSKEHPIFHKPGSIRISSVEDFLKLYPNSFDRLGSLKGEYDIKVDPTVPPVQHARRKVPIEIKAAIKEAIDYMVKQDILEPQIEPTPWVSSVTYPVKPTGEVRPCLDARDLNKAIIRENHKPQTVEEIAHQLAGAVVFTKADALKAFLQVHLTEESSKLLVINTHKGCYRFKRMPFGAKMSQDVFQMKMDLIMERCPGVISIHDDIVVYSVSDEDHDANLINLLNVAMIKGLVLNSKKLELKCPRVSFFGAEYSADGMHPCPKIQGITEMTPPIDKQQLSSFIGMVTYMGNFVPHLSHHTESLRAMLKQDVVFAWDEVANASFQKIKDLIAKSATKPLQYYDRRKPVTVQADASQTGLGACLLQEGKPIAYASKSLTDTETRYANIERELLAIVFACQQFNMYVLGRPFTVESDHKPLEMIHQKSLASAPPRLQRMLLQLQQYNVTIKY